MFQTIYSIGAVVALSIVVLLAIWKGGPTEQLGAGIAAAAWTASAILQSINDDDYAWWLGGVDIAAFLAFAVLAWRSTRDWPIITAAFQAVSVAVGVLFLLDVTIPPAIYVTALAISALGVLSSILWGVYTYASGPTPPSATT